jgi:hypothetical protein
VTTAVDGVVLCRVGASRLAVACDEVDAIAEPEGEVVDSAAAFGEAPRREGRALQAAGQLLRVDSVDVVSTPGLSVLPVPAALGHLVGGAVTGFVVLSGHLWPLISVRLLLAHLSTVPAA